MTTETHTQQVLITGGANGLGLALAKAHARRGDHVCILDRDARQGQEALVALRGLQPDARFITCDLTDPEDCDRAITEMQARWPVIDRLYNNAGIAGSVSKVERSSDSNWQRVFDINVFAPVRLTRLVVPFMKQSRNGTIVNIASMAGLLSASHMSAYSASKAAMISLSETLQKELHDDGISVTVACPAFFRTQLAESIPEHEAKARASVEKLMQRGKLSADDVAGIIIKAADKGRFYCLPHRNERWLWHLKKFSHQALFKIMLKAQH